MRTWTDAAAEDAMADEVRSGGWDGSPVRLTWTPERAEWTEAVRAVSPFHRAARPVGVLLVLLGVAGRLLLGSWTALVVLVAVGVFVFFLTELQVQSSFARNPRAALEHRAVLDATGVHLALSDATTDLAWSAFTSWLERPRAFVLRLGRASSTPVLVLPKDAVDDPTAARIRAALAARIAGR